MPILRVPSRDAVVNRKKPLAHWPTRGAADNRIEPIARPAFDPTFSFAPGATVFTMGSCFARHVEDALLARGFTVPTRARDLEETVGPAGNSILNNYGVPALLNEIRWALGVGAPYDPKAQLFEVYPAKFADVHLPHHLRLCSFEQAVARRERIFELNRSIRTADVAIFTLGMAEVWFDRLTGTHLNAPPYETVVRADPERFELHVLDYDEIFGQLDELFALIFAHCSLWSGVILTVSPVPLSATYTSQDVAVANQYSKSVLRAAAGAIAQKYARIDYFPSYESVILSDRQVAWDFDLVHVTRRLVDVNVGRMIERYVGPDHIHRESTVTPLAEPSQSHGAGEDEEAVKRARAMMREGQWAAAMASVQGLRSTYDWVERLRIVGECQRELGQADRAEQAFRAALALYGADAHAHGGLGLALKAQGRLDEAIVSLTTAVDFSRVAEWPVRLAETLIETGRTAEARALVQRSLGIWPADAALVHLQAQLDGEARRKSQAQASLDLHR